MITSRTWENRGLFRAEPWAKLFVRNLFEKREAGYQLHEFVLMPDHFPVLLTPKASLEKAAQLIKGGFSYRVRSELKSNMEVWQKGFSDHRIRDAADYEKHVNYIHQNPVRAKLVERPSEYLYSSAYPGYRLSPVPDWLRAEKAILGG